MIAKIKTAIKVIFGIARSSVPNRPPQEMYDFNKSNPLGGNGERVDIHLQSSTNIDFNKLDIYQQNHFRRYEFAKRLVFQGDVCGDFACGTGYGSVMISDKANAVIGADLDAFVIEAIQKRYVDIKNVQFLKVNLLSLSYKNYFNTIISFETLEHFEENDIKLLLKIFATALKEKGRLIFSTPYMQNKSEAAIEMGFHSTFYINEEKINEWLGEAGLTALSFSYQNYETHNIEEKLEKKDFIICVANKN